MTPPAETLRQCADTFLRAGQDSAAHFARRMADDAADLNEVKPGLGDALYSHWAGQMAERAERVRR